jgi:shikimate kinase
VASPLTDRALVFAGFMGAGKTVAAQAAAKAWGVEAIDTDALVERELGVRIPDFFADQGEEAFRLREEIVIAHALDHAPPGSVVALGGGALGSPRVREAAGPTGRWRPTATPSPACTPSASRPTRPPPRS